MGRERGVTPDRVRLPLSDGDYVDVKRELNAGEYRKLLYSQFKDNPAGDALTVDPAKVGIAKLLAYLLGWSLVSVVDHQPIPYDPQDPEELRRAVLDDLDTATYKELIAVVTAHEAQQDAATEAQKKTRITAPLSSVTS
jgi:hypothetical protein